MHTTRLCNADAHRLLYSLSSTDVPALLRALSVEYSGQIPFLQVTTPAGAGGSGLRAGLRIVEANPSARGPASRTAQSALVFVKGIRSDPGQLQASRYNGKMDHSHTKAFLDNQM